MVSSFESQLVEGRACGSCNVCCVALTIDDPALQKAQGYRCRNALPDNGCAIYADRPETCRTFYCGWRRLRWVRQPLRPDTSGLLVLLERAGSRKGTPGYKVTFSFLDRAALKVDGVVETIAAAVAANVPSFIQVPGPPGYTAGLAQLNEALRAPVAARSKAGVLTILTQAYEMGLQGDNEPVILVPRPPGRRPR